MLFLLDSCRSVFVPDKWERTSLCAGKLTAFSFFLRTHSEPVAEYPPSVSRTLSKHRSGFQPVAADSSQDGSHLGEHPGKHCVSAFWRRTGPTVSDMVGTGSSPRSMVPDSRSLAGSKQHAVSNWWWLLVCFSLDAGRQWLVKFRHRYRF